MVALVETTSEEVVALRAAVTEAAVLEEVKTGLESQTVTVVMVEAVEQALVAEVEAQ